MEKEVWLSLFAAFSEVVHWDEEDNGALSLIAQQRWNKAQLRVRNIIAHKLGLVSLEYNAEDWEV